MAREVSSVPIGKQQEKSWHTSIVEDFHGTTETAVRSARSLRQSSSTQLHNLEDNIPHLKSLFKIYEDAFFRKVKDELLSAKEHPLVAGGVVLASGLLLMRSPRRFLLRHTIGRFQSEEARFVRAEKNVKELNISVDVLKKESHKLLERAALAENDMTHGHTKLMNAGSELQRVAKSTYKVECQAAGVMDGLREIPGREALKLRAEVASMASLLEQQRSAMNKRISKISELEIHF